jgi:hypothetical protein
MASGPIPAKIPCTRRIEHAPQMCSLMTSVPDMLTRLRRRWKVLSTFSRRQLQKLGPYPSLVAMLLPIALVEPLKIVAVCVAGQGHWLTGTGIMIAAYTASLLVVERLFRIVRPKLMNLGWFAGIWMWVTGVRLRIPSWFAATLAKFAALSAKCRSTVVTEP